MSRLDEFLPEYDVRERHERRVAGTPELMLAAALGIPVAPDRIGVAGRPWSPRSRLVPFDRAGPGQIRLVFDITATAVGDGVTTLATETRVAAMDARSRRALRAYWLAVGPFSALIRRRWLAAAERALR
jgi:hypothetical protein